MSGERGRGVILYGLAALLVIIGGVWWWRAAPRANADQRLLEWRLTAEQLLPETEDQEASDTMALAADTEYEKVAETGAGAFQISVVCAGPDDSRVRVRLGDEDDSGLGLRCSGSRTPEVFSVAVGTELHLKVVVEQDGPVVFRYTVQRNQSN